MRASNYNIYKLEDGFTGRASEIAKHLNTSTTYLFRVLNKNGKLKGQTIQILRNFKKTYGVYKNGELIMKGECKDIAKKLCIAEVTVRNAIGRKGKLLWKYEIKELKDEQS